MWEKHEVKNVDISVYFSAHFTEEDEEGAKEVIKVVGNAFNEQLRMGKHPSLFTGF